CTATTISLRSSFPLQTSTSTALSVIIMNWHRSNAILMIVSTIAISMTFWGTIRVQLKRLPAIFSNGAMRAGRKFLPYGSARRPRHGPSTDRDTDTHRGNFWTHDTGGRRADRRADSLRQDRWLRLS